MVHLIYASSASREFTAADLAALLRQVRTANEALGVTGILLHAEGSFFQVLEGEAETVDALFAKISRDTRHRETTTIIHEPILARAFADWTMGFAAVDSAEVGDIIGVNDFFGAGCCFSRLDAGRAKKLLKAFSQGRWRVRVSHAPPSVA